MKFCHSFARLVSLSALALAIQSTEALAAPPPKPSSTIDGTQVGLGDCAFTPRRLGLGSILVTSIVSQGFNLIGNALTAAGRDKTWTSSASRNFDGSQESGLPQCIQVVRGKFRVDGTNGNQSWARQWPTAVQGLNDNGLYLDAEPDFIFEGMLVPSKDNSALAIRPTFAYFVRPSGKKSASSDLTRAVAVFVAFHKPGDTITNEGSPGTAIVLGPMSPGSFFTFAQPRTDTGQNASIESPWFSISAEDAKSPLTVTVVQTETQPGSPFLAFLASVFNDDPVRQGLEAATTALIIPAPKPKAAAPAGGDS